MRRRGVCPCEDGAGSGALWAGRCEASAAYIVEDPELRSGRAPLPRIGTDRRP